MLQHTQRLQSYQQKYELQQRRSLPSLDDTQLLSGRCPVRKDTEGKYKVKALYLIHVTNLMRHLRYKFIEVRHRFIDVYNMCPVTFLYIRLSSGTLHSGYRIQAGGLRERTIEYCGRNGLTVDLP